MAPPQTHPQAQHSSGGGGMFGGAGKDMMWGALLGVIVALLFGGGNLELTALGGLLGAGSGLMASGRGGKMLSGIKGFFSKLFGKGDDDPQQAQGRQQEPAVGQQADNEVTNPGPTPGQTQRRGASIS